MAERNSLTSTLSLGVRPSGGPFDAVNPLWRVPVKTKVPAKRRKTPTRDLSVKKKAKPQPNAVERAVYDTFGLEPNIRRSTLLPFARNEDSGRIELTTPQVLYDAARALVAPGVVLSGQPVDLQNEAQNFAWNFSGAGLGAHAASPLDGAVLGMSGKGAGKRAVRRAGSGELDLYHGMRGPMEGDALRPSATGEFGPGVYTTTSRKEAEGYTLKHPEGRVLNVKANVRNPFVVREHPDEFWNAFGGGTDEEAVQRAIAAGHDAVAFQRPVQHWDDNLKRLVDTGETQTHYNVFDPANLSIERASGFRVRPASVAMDPRIESRVGELPKVHDMEVELTPRQTTPAEEVSIFDLEGRPFITSMSDMSAAGDDITAINDVVLPEAVQRMGGQDYMFRYPGAWAADLGSAGRHLDAARRLKTETGYDPFFMPWMMGPTSIDFAHMPRELMLRYAAGSMGRKSQRELSKDIRGILPDFKAIDDPTSVELFREASGKHRDALNRLLDRYRDKGGIGIGAARLANTDLEQIGMPLTSLRNVGVIEANAALSPSVHPSYRTSIPGHGVGRLKEPIGALELLPDLMAEAQLTDPFGFPVGVVPGVKSPLRAMQMGPKGGIITEDMLRAIEARLAAEKPE